MVYFRTPLKGSNKIVSPRITSEAPEESNISQSLSFIFVGVAAGLIVNACSRGWSYVCYQIPLLYPFLAFCKSSDVSCVNGNQNVTPNQHDKVIEVCCSDIESILEAMEGGATSLELCSDRPQGGITPSISLIEEAVKQTAGTNILTHVLVRPRPGGFVYSRAEFHLMVRDVLAAKSAGAHGVVVGVLTSDGRIDIPRMRLLRTVSRGMLLTFHRAFDVSCGNPVDDLHELIQIGCDRLLTSGRSACAMDDVGSSVLARLVDATPNTWMSANSLRTSSSFNSLTTDSSTAIASATNTSEPKTEGLLDKLFGRFFSPPEKLGDATTQTEPTSLDSEIVVSESTQDRAVFNASNLNFCSLTIVAAAGISSGTHLCDFLKDTKIRAIHAGSSVTALRWRLPDKRNDAQKCNRDDGNPGPTVHMGVAESADTDSFSCVVAEKVSDLVKDSMNTWEYMDKIHMKNEFKRLLIHRNVTQSPFKRCPDDSSSVCSGSVANSDDEHYDAARGS
eukprot:GSChrysophyteH1.ASY1.ANO1.1736.1 assembled CDS